MKTLIHRKRSFCLPAMDLLRSFTIFLVSITAPFSLLGEETNTQLWNVEIPGPIADGTRTKSVPPPEPINFNVLKSRTTRMRVTKAPEMADLPPITGTINVTVQRVDDPRLPKPPPPLPVSPPDDPAVIARMEERQKQYLGTQLLFVSATVYDHSHTFLQIYPSGKGEGEISAWSNIDFNHFSGFSTFRIQYDDGTFRDYGLLMGIGDTDTDQRHRWSAEHERDYQEPEIPYLPDIAIEGPSFVVAGGQTKGMAMDVLSQVHDLYRKEGQRMESAYHARVKAHAERKAYLLVNPPTPKDITIQFWKREKPTDSQSNTEGANQP